MRITNELESKINAILADFSCELFSAEFLRENENEILRISLMPLLEEKQKVEISLDLCEKVSAVLSPFLDVELGECGRYFLEISSAGIERKLKTPRQMLGAVGELVSVKFSENGVKCELCGTLLSVGADFVEILEQDSMNKKSKKSSKNKSIKTAKNTADSINSDSINLDSIESKSANEKPQNVASRKILLSEISKMQTIFMW